MTEMTGIVTSSSQRKAYLYLYLDACDVGDVNPPYGGLFFIDLLYNILRGRGVGGVNVTTSLLCNYAD